jgi:deoxycytidylate deaminase
MVGVVADDNVRQVRLKEQKHIEDREFEQISEIDADEKIGYGQQALRAILKSDYFFANNSSTRGEIVSECRRLLNLVFNSDIVTPRADEFGMHVAHMAADKSACLSRQVGAAIVSEKGDLLATGSNDVPEFGGGLYTSESERDERCFLRSGFCYNDDEKRIIADEILVAIRGAGFRIKDANYNKIKDILLNKTRLKMLIEFSRAVHAEMDAIITVARTAALGLVGSTLYVTTYPCHNCAKHIIDAGIKRVVFLEPYVKSLAQKLHSDAINNPLESPNPHKVTFDNYGGVAPDRYAKFFSMHGERKEDSKFIRKTRVKDTLYPITAQEVSVLKINLKDFDGAFAKIYVKGENQVMASTPALPSTAPNGAAAEDGLEEIGPANGDGTAATSIDNS